MARWQISKTSPARYDFNVTQLGVLADLIHIVDHPMCELAVGRLSDVACGFKRCMIGTGVDGTSQINTPLLSAAYHVG